MEEETCVIKNLEKGEQETISQNELLKYFQKLSLLF
jgi:hypothetical protein